MTGTAALAVSSALLAGSWTLAFHLGQLSHVFSNLAFAYEDYGFSYCFLQTWLNRGIHQPSRYSAQEMSRIREMIEADTPPQIHKPMSMSSCTAGVLYRPSRNSGVGAVRGCRPHLDSLD